MTTELERAKKDLVAAALRFYHGAEAPTPKDWEWLFLNLVNHDEGGMEELMEKFGGEYTEQLEWGNEDHAEKWQEIVDKVIEAEKETK